MDDKVLSVALRPRALEFLIGGKKLVTALRQQMATRPPSAFMFCGPPGTGKTTLARIIALSFQCTHQEIWGRPCMECWNNWNGFNIHEVNAATENGVEEIGRLIQLSKYDPMPPSLKRVFILDEAHAITTQAQRSLLKVTEDIPKNTIWIFATTDPTKLSAALQRRFVSYHLNGMTPDRVDFLLKRAAKFAAFSGPLTPLTDELKRAEVTSPGVILMAFEHFASGQSALESVTSVQNMTAGKTDTFAICQAVVAGKWGDVRTHLRDATAEESRFIRASVSGYLKGCLLRENNPIRLEKLAMATRMLMGIAPLDDAGLFPWLVATLAQLCKTLK